MNYSLQEYANDVVYTHREASAASQELPMPHIISESGRALTAHHALLLLKVIDVESQVEPVPPALREEPHALLLEMSENLEASTRRTGSSEVFHDATFDKERAQELFQQRRVLAARRRDAEQIYLATMNALQQRDRRRSGRRIPEIVDDLEATLVDRYFCNFSLFQSLPDSWAIDQLFPDHADPPAGRGADAPRHAAGHDLRLRRQDRPVRRRAQGQALARAASGSREGEPYILGIFLTGAYQEILGDLHNLFGDTNAVHIRLTEQGYEITDLVHGDTVTEVLNYVQFRASDLLATFRRKVSAREGADPAGGQHLHRGLRGGAGGVHVSRGGRGAGIGRGAHARRRTA